MGTPRIPTSTGTRPSTRVNRNRFASQQFTYPEDLTSERNQPYSIFDVRDSVAKGGKSLNLIALPLPNNLTVQYSTNYEDISLKSQQVADFLKLGITDSSEAGRQAGEAFGAGLFSILNGPAELERQRGAIVNPHMAALFKGVNFRTFNFEYDFLAKSEAESNSINNILKAFKIHMHPDIPAEAAGARFMLYPENFVIGIFSPSNDHLFKISLCALTNMNVSYNGAGIPAFFRDTGAPVHIKMSLQFKELEIMTKDRIRQNF